MVLLKVGNRGKGTEREPDLLKNKIGLYMRTLIRTHLRSLYGASLQLFLVPPVRLAALGLSRFL